MRLEGPRGAWAARFASTIYDEPRGLYWDTADLLVVAYGFHTFGLDAAEGEALASFGQLEILPSEEVDAAQVRRRIAERRETLRGEVERAERKLSNQGFVSNAPAEVVEAEREKLTTYRAELEELEG